MQRVLYNREKSRKPKLISLKRPIKLIINGSREKGKMKNLPITSEYPAKPTDTKRKIR